MSCKASCAADLTEPTKRASEQIPLGDRLNQYSAQRDGVGSSPASEEKPDVSLWGLGTVSERGGVGGLSTFLGRPTIAKRFYVFALCFLTIRR